MALCLAPETVTPPAYSGCAVSLPSSVVDHASVRLAAFPVPIVVSVANPLRNGSWSTCSQSPASAGGGGGGGSGSVTVSCTPTVFGEPLAPAAPTVRVP